MSPNLWATKIAPSLSGSTSVGTLDNKDVLIVSVLLSVVSAWPLRSNTRLGNVSAHVSICIWLMVREALHIVLIILIILLMAREAFARCGGCCCVKKLIHIFIRRHLPSTCACSHQPSQPWSRLPPTGQSE